VANAASLCARKVQTLPISRLAQEIFEYMPAQNKQAVEGGVVGGIVGSILDGMR
jgi:hypothetical protein